MNQKEIHFVGIWSEFFVSQEGIESLNKLKVYLFHGHLFNKSVFF